MIPFELITMLGSAVLGGTMKLIGMNMEVKKLQTELLMKSAGMKMRAVQQARSVKNIDFQWTRRVIALSAVFAIIVWPKVAPIVVPGLPVELGWLDYNPGFNFLWFSFGEDSSLEWHTAKGLVLTPLDTNLLSAIVGMYFGGSLVGHNR